MMQKRVYFIRSWDDEVMALPANQPLSFYAVAKSAEWRICSRKEYLKGLKRRRLLSWQKATPDIRRAA